MFPVKFPASDRACVYRPADLCRACGSHVFFRGMEVEARLVPGKPAKIYDSARMALRVADEILVLDLEHRLRQDAPPVGHQDLIMAQIRAELEKVAGEGNRTVKFYEVAGYGDIAEVPPTVDSSRSWEERRYQPEMAKVEGKFVGHA